MGLNSLIIIGDTGDMGQAIKYQGTAGNPTKKIPVTLPGANHSAATPGGASSPAAIKKQKIKDLAHSLAKPAYDSKELQLTGRALQVMNALQLEGFKEPLLKILFTMLYMESGAFTNSPAVRDFNPGNIMWRKQAGATRGTYIAANKDYVAHFPNYDAFAAEFKRELSKGPGYPINAVTAPDLVHRLKMNNYFGAESEASYLSKLAGAAQRLRIIHRLQDDANQSITNNAGNKPAIGPLGWLGLGIVGIIAAGSIFKAAGN